MSEIRPFLLGLGSLVGWTFVVGAAAIADLLDFFPICIKLGSSMKFCTGKRNSVIQRNR